MLTIIRLQLIWCGLIIAVKLDLFEGENCTLSNGVDEGVCQFTSDCPQLKSIPQKEWRTCVIYNMTPVVCCPRTEAKISPARTQTRIASKSELKCATFPNASDAGDRITGTGSLEASSDDFPHIGALGYTVRTNQPQPFRCGASLISYQYLLTAAHCVTGEPPLYARFGVLDLFNFSTTEPPVDIAIEKVIIHPNYTSRPLRNDVALLKLNRTATEPFLIPACLYVNLTDPAPHVNLSIAGWGSTDPNDIELSSVLRKANVTTLDRAACNNTLAKDKSRRSTGELQTTQLCALGRNTRNETTGDTCVGDSGGPLALMHQRHHYIVGVTSNGKLCGTSSPGIYSRVAYYLDWIESIVWRDDYHSLRGAMAVPATLLLVVFLGRYTFSQSIIRLPDLFEKDPCPLKNGNTGVCRRTSDCMASYRAGESHCEFLEDKVPVICCAPVPNATFDSSARVVNEACASVRKTGVRIADHAVGVVTEAKVGEFPFMALVVYADVRTRCGASLISNRFLLTAAHCFRSGKPLSIRLGTNQADDSLADTYNIAKIYRHKDYSHLSKQNDIALIELRDPVTMNDQVQPICLYTSLIDLPESANLTLMGWGKDNAENLPNSLLKGTVNPVLRSTCQARFTAGGYPLNLTDKQICALGELNSDRVATDTCEGDSGGPLVLAQDNKFYLVGLVSTGPGCGDENYAGIYTRVSSYLDWIIERAWKR
ncbi:transmembrane protease serine 9-like [Wyeomyia smithii]|uniref:transmembrane protease serine 9-like n=1 Tax=Wyeomyia smithii TaxID=174621 RepID=UPI002467E92B|nr:transmembrane protease serine 9-like [Wyeomyia smithii]